VHKLCTRRGKAWDRGQQGKVEIDNYTEVSDGNAVQLNTASDTNVVEC
jgi:hypothetical protein